MQGRQTVQTQFPRGLWEMYGLGGNWVSLILNGAVVAETHRVDIPPCPRTRPSVHLLHAPRVHGARTIPRVHTRMLFTRTHKHTHTFPLHCDLSSPVE